MKRKVTGLVGLILVVTIIICGMVDGLQINTQKVWAADSTGYADIDRFPVSYRAALVALKNAHPSWVFDADYTGVDWNYIYSIECSGSYSLIPSSFPAENIEAPYGNGWSYASDAAVQFYLDPRNWLKEDTIFMFMDLSYHANLDTEATINKVLSGTFMAVGNSEYNSPSNNSAFAAAHGGLCYATEFRNLGEYWGISGVHLAARVRQEQGVAGDSPLISGTYPGYEGYYNYFNIGATGSSAGEVYATGLSEAKNANWNNRHDALFGGSKLVAQRIKERGQKTIYYQKFDVAYLRGARPGDYIRQYMQNICAPSTEGRTMSTAYKRAGLWNEAITFTIPVYNNMPNDYSTIPPENFVISSAADADLVMFVRGSDAADSIATAENMAAFKSVYDQFANYIDAVSVKKKQVQGVFIQHDSDNNYTALTLSQPLSAYTSESALMSEVLKLIQARYEFALGGTGLDTENAGYLDNLTIVLEGDGLTLNTAVHGDYEGKATIGRYKVGNYSIVKYSDVVTTDVSMGSAFLAKPYLEKLGIPNVSVEGYSWDIMSDCANGLKFPLEYFVNMVGWDDTVIQGIKPTGAYSLMTPYEAITGGSRTMQIKSPIDDYCTIVLEYRDAASAAVSNGFDHYSTSSLLIYSVKKVDGKYVVEMLDVITPDNKAEKFDEGDSYSILLPAKDGESPVDTQVDLAGLSFNADNTVSFNVNIDYNASGTLSNLIEPHTNNYQASVYSWAKNAAEGENTYSLYTDNKNMLRILKYTDGGWSVFPTGDYKIDNIVGYEMCDMKSSSSDNRILSMAYVQKDSTGKRSLYFQYYSTGYSMWMNVSGSGCISEEIASEDISIAEDETNIYIGYVVNTSSGQQIVIKDMRGTEYAKYNVSGTVVDFDIVRTGGNFYLLLSYETATNYINTTLRQYRNGSWTKVEGYSFHGTDNTLICNDNRLYALVKNDDKAVLSIYDGAEVVNVSDFGHSIKDMALDAQDGVPYLACYDGSDVYVLRYSAGAFVEEAKIAGVNASDIGLTLVVDSDPSKLNAQVLIKNADAPNYKIKTVKVNKPSYSLSITISDENFTIENFYKYIYDTDGTTRIKDKIYLYVDGVPVDVTAQAEEANTDGSHTITLSTSGLTSGVARTAQIFRYKPESIIAQGMYCYTLSCDEASNTYTATLIPELTDFMEYGSVAIRLDESAGIRYISKMKNDVLTSLTSSAGRTNEGSSNVCKLVELGTVVRSDKDVAYPFVYLGKRTSSGRSFWYTSSGAQNNAYYSKDATYTTYANVLKNIAPTYYDTYYSGCMYAKIDINGHSYLYYSPGNSKSLFWIAKYYMDNKSTSALPGTSNYDICMNIVHKILPDYVYDGEGGTP